MSLDASIVDFLRTKQLLLVLDNCEHLLDGAGALRRARRPRLSRRAHRSRRAARVSRVDGERMRPLRSLVAARAVATRPTTSRAATRRRLFVDRAACRAAGLRARRDATRPAVAEICRRLDGIPLAIELAAARVVSMNPDEIAALLDERFRLLTGGRRTAVERHQTLRAAVDWSYSLLTESEQRRLRTASSVFAGSFSTDDADRRRHRRRRRHVGRDRSSAAWWPSRCSTTDEAARGPMRYRLLETMRQYALDRLDGTDDPDAGAVVTPSTTPSSPSTPAPGCWASDELAWRPRMLTELDNLRTAVAWALDAEDQTDREARVRIVAGLSNEANAGSSLGVGSWAERALPFVDATTPERRAAVLSAASWNALLGGDLELARDRAYVVLGIEPRGLRPRRHLRAALLHCRHPTGLRPCGRHAGRRARGHRSR